MKDFGSPVGLPDQIVGKIFLFFLKVERIFPCVSRGSSGTSALEHARTIFSPLSFLFGVGLLPRKYHEFFSLLKVSTNKCLGWPEGEGEQTSEILMAEKTTKLDQGPR
ncbi:hypothetical protein CEXT_403141 [Caerostris extrusa]|uniref:Uncharacterized protein n=1 Tax=Caerostris extrusa TaxID=172846 RepID=A0AAV4XAJ5_CAEEX|nr:hypothetical protein CEXT_403141 [Caerostris extrusa]